MIEDEVEDEINTELQGFRIQYRTPFDANELDKITDKIKYALLNTIASEIVEMDFQYIMPNERGIIFKLDSSISIKDIVMLYKFIKKQSKISIFNIALDDCFHSIYMYQFNVLEFVLVLAKRFGLELNIKIIEDIAKVDLHEDKINHIINTCIDNNFDYGYIFEIKQNDVAFVNCIFDNAIDIEHFNYKLCTSSSKNMSDMPVSFGIYINASFIKSYKFGELINIDKDYIHVHVANTYTAIYFNLDANTTIIHDMLVDVIDYLKTNCLK